jgi:hypothetical protein
MPWANKTGPHKSDVMITDCNWVRIVLSWMPDGRLTRLRLSTYPSQIEFVRNERGEATAIIFHQGWRDTRVEKKQ